MESKLIPIILSTAEKPIPANIPNSPMPTKLADKPPAKPILHRATPAFLFIFSVSAQTFSRITYMSFFLFLIMSIFRSFTPTLRAPKTL